MKKLLLSLIAIICSSITWAQNVQVLYGEEWRIVTEYTKTTTNSMSYIYGEFALEKNKTKRGYFQLIREQKFWKMPLYLHAELRGYVTEGFSTNLTYIGGLGYNLIEKQSGYLSAQALYRYDNRSNWQIGLSGEWRNKYLLYVGYADFYGADDLNIHSEHRFYYRALPWLDVGVNFDLYYNNDDDFDWMPFAIVKFNI